MNSLVGAPSLLASVSAGLEREVRTALTEDIVGNIMGDLEVKVRSLLKPFVEDITISRAETLANMLKLRDELHVFVHVGDE